MDTPTPHISSHKAMLIICGPSGVGKSTLVHTLLERRPELTLSLSHTTRLPRGTEQNGVDYHFVDKTTFQNMVQHNAFAEHANVFGNLYGTTFSEIQTAWDNHKNLLFDIDYQGAEQLRKNFPHATSILVFPPSLEQLRKRLVERKTDALDVIEARLNKASLELSQWPHFDYIIVNDDLEEAVNHLLHIYDSLKLRTFMNRTWLEEKYPTHSSSNIT